MGRVKKIDLICLRKILEIRHKGYTFMLYYHVRVVNEPAMFILKLDGTRFIHILFTLNDGTPGAIVTYTLTSNNTGFIPINDEVTLDAAGDGTVAIPALTKSPS